MKTKTNEQRIMENGKWRNIPLFIFLFSFFISIASCDSNDESHLNGDPQAVQFSGTSAVATPQTRVLNNTWENGNKVGIYMLKKDDPEIAEGAENREYTTDIGGNFTPVGQTIYYPQDGSAVNFVAYYPYQSTLTNGVYKVDVSKQDDANTIIDLLYSKDATNKSKSTAVVAMTFTHRLTKLTIKTEAGVGLTAADLTGLGVTIKGMPQTADLDLLNNSLSNESVGNISPKVETADEKYSAILIPQNKKADSKVSFAVANIGTFDWDMSAIDFEGGNHYTYTITIGRTGLTVSDCNIANWEGTGNTETGSITMPVIETVLIKAGTFQMGSPGGDDDDPDADAFDDEKPRHWVKLTQDYRMSKYEITNAQYAVFLNAVNVGKNGQYNGNGLIFDSSQSGFSPWGLQWDTDKWVSHTGYENHPVIYVSWYGAMEFATWLGGRLPTEAQWEYACRAGTETIYSFEGDANKLGDYAWYNGSETHAVGTKKSNPWGLHDMHGNVFEWCRDQWDRSNNYPTDATTENKAVVDPLVEAGDYRVLRGGSWNDDAQGCRSAYRGGSTPGSGRDIVGLRVVFPLSSL